MNAHSSRSHALLQVRVELRERGDLAKVTRAKINFVDLAGSERWKVRERCLVGDIWWKAGKKKGALPQACEVVWV